VETVHRTKVNTPSTSHNRTRPLLYLRSAIVFVTARRRPVYRNPLSSTPNSSRPVEVQFLGPISFHSSSVPNGTGTLLSLALKWYLAFLPEDRTCRNAKLATRTYFPTLLPRPCVRGPGTTLFSLFYTTYNAWGGRKVWQWKGQHSVNSIHYL
jgi:hypothetical protein